MPIMVHVLAKMMTVVGRFQVKSRTLMSTWKMRDFFYFIQEGIYLYQRGQMKVGHNIPRIHIIVLNDVTYETRMDIQWKPVICMNVIYRNDMKGCKVKRWLNHRFERESPCTRPFSPYVNVNSIQDRITGRGLAKPRGRMHGGHLSLIQITWTKCAMSSFNTNCAGSTSGLNKM